MVVCSVVPVCRGHEAESIAVVGNGNVSSFFVFIVTCYSGGVIVRSPSTETFYYDMASNWRCGGSRFEGGYLLGVTTPVKSQNRFRVLSSS